MIGTKENDVPVIFQLIRSLHAAEVWKVEARVANMLAAAVRASWIARQKVERSVGLGVP
jgi:hypothetical protein